VFAATGAAALLARWEQRHLFLDTAATTALELNLASTQVQLLIQKMLEVLAPVLPLVESATPEQLARLLGPPVDERAEKLFEFSPSAIAHSEALAHRSQQQLEAAQMLAGRLLPDVHLDPQGWDGEQWWRATWVKRYMLAFADGPNAASRMTASGGRAWAEVARLVDQMADLCESLQAVLPSQDVRMIVKDTKHLRVAIADASAPGGHLEFLGATSSAQPPGTVGVAVGELWSLLHKALEISHEVAELRIRFRQQFSDDNGGELGSPQWVIRRHDWADNLFRETALIVVPSSIYSAWKSATLSE
jgi:hypothetical protein